MKGLRGAYPSNHAIIVGSVGNVLAELFPEMRARFLAMGREACESRIFGGIHYRFDVDTALSMARKLSDAALAADASGKLLARLD